MKQFSILRCVVLSLVALLPRGASSRQSGDLLVVIGAGAVGPWDTVFQMANGSPQDDDVALMSALVEGTCESLCPTVPVHIPGSGTARISSSSLPPLFTAVSYVGRAMGAELPMLTARAVNGGTGQGCDLPVIKLSTLLALDPTILVFPGARRAPTAHSNLVVGEVSGSGGLSMTAEVFSSTGQLLGSLPLSVPNDPGREDGVLTLTDVLGRAGVSALDAGQIRVTKTGGSGLMWGLLTTVFDDGHVETSIGLNP